MFHKFTHLPDGGHSSKKSSISVLLTNLDFGLFLKGSRIWRTEGGETYLDNVKWLGYHCCY